VKQLDEAFDIQSAFDEIEQNNRDVLAGLVYSWVLAVNLWQLGDDALLDRIPTPVEVEIHEKFLSQLIKLGHFFAPRIRNFGPDDLAQFGLKSDGLLALITKLEEMAEERKEIL
jgi:hypothetical protein